MPRDNKAGHNRREGSCIVGGILAKQNEFIFVFHFGIMKIII
jgi:hypothetical protein